MRRAGIEGISGRPRYRCILKVATASDQVDRQFHRDHPDQLWVTDITEHPTREGKVYWTVVLDVFSRRVVGWSIDSAPTAALMTNALGMAIQQRQPAEGTVIHSDQGTKFTSWAFTREPSTRASSPPWGQWTTASSTRSSSRSGAGCRSSSLTGRSGGHVWSWQRDLRVPRIFHNRQRRHSVLGMLSPVQFEAGHQPATAA